MNIVFSLVMLLASLLLLVVSSNFLVNSALRFAFLFHLPMKAVGLVVLALGTSLPEMFISVTAALQNNGDMSVGNIVGSNITNVLLIIGSMACLFPKLLFSKNRGEQNSSLQENHLLLLITLLFIALLFYPVFKPPLMGLLMLVCGGVFLWCIFHKNNNNAEKELSIKISFFSRLTTIIALLFGLALLQISAFFVLESAESIGEWLGWSQIIVGAILLALGTSLPELSVCITVALRGKNELFWSNIIGSNMINLAFGGGLSFLFFQHQPSLPPFMGFCLLASTVGLWLLVFCSKWGIMRIFARFFLLFYGLFLFFLVS